MLLDESKIVDLIGKKFEWGGKGPDSYDCYGLVSEIYVRHGVKLPEYRSTKLGGEIIATMLSASETPIWHKSVAFPGAVVLMKLPKSMHVAVALSYGKMIHCWEGSNGVCVERMADWNKRVIGYYEFRSSGN